MPWEELFLIWTYFKLNYIKISKNKWVLIKKISSIANKLCKIVLSLARKMRGERLYTIHSFFLEGSLVASTESVSLLKVSSSESLRTSSACNKT